MKTMLTFRLTEHFFESQMLDSKAPLECLGPGSDQGRRPRSLYITPFTQGRYSSQICGECRPGIATTVVDRVKKCRTSLSY